MKFTFAGPSRKLSALKFFVGAKGTIAGQAVNDPKKVASLEPEKETTSCNNTCRRYCWRNSTCRR